MQGYGVEGASRAQGISQEALGVSWQAMLYELERGVGRGKNICGHHTSIPLGNSIAFSTNEPRKQAPQTKAREGGREGVVLDFRMAAAERAPRSNPGDCFRRQFRFQFSGMNEIEALLIFLLACPVSVLFIRP